MAQQIPVLEAGISGTDFIFIYATRLARFVFHQSSGSIALVIYAAALYRGLPYCLSWSDFALDYQIYEQKRSPASVRERAVHGGRIARSAGIWIRVFLGNVAPRVVSLSGVLADGEDVAFSGETERDAMMPKSADLCNVSTYDLARLEMRQMPTCVSCAGRTGLGRRMHQRATNVARLCHASDASSAGHLVTAH